MVTLKKLGLAALVALVACAPDMAPDVPAETTYDATYDRGPAPDNVVFTENGRICSWVGSDFWECFGLPAIDGQAVEHTLLHDGEHRFLQTVEARVMQGGGFEVESGRVWAEGDLVAWSFLSDPFTVHVLSGGVESSFRVERPAIYDLRVDAGAIWLGYQESLIQYSSDGEVLY